MYTVINKLRPEKCVYFADTWNAIFNENSFLLNQIRYFAGECSVEDNSTYL